MISNRETVEKNSVDDLVCGLVNSTVHTRSLAASMTFPFTSVLNLPRITNRGAFPRTTLSKNAFLNHE